MTLNPELIQVAAGGGLYDGWEKVEITASIKEAARAFTLETTERSVVFASEFSFPPGTPVQILANGELLVDGYVNEYKPSGDARSHRITVSGRGKGQDFIDSSAMYEPGYWENKTPEDIAKDLDKFGVGIKAKAQLDKIPYYQSNQGESCFKCVERAIRHQGATMMGEPDGSISITNASVAGRHSGGLIEGHNIERYQGQISDQDRNSEVNVKGQNRLGHGDENLRIKETAKDPGVKRYRPKIIVNETDTDKKRARKRADHEQNRRQGFAVRATITTQGWRDDGGKVWEPNNLVNIQSALLKISGDLLLESIRLTQDNGGEGSLAQLSLVNAKAYGGDGGSGSSSSQWG